MANRAAGKGYENENFYDNIKFQFFGIENIHVMRSSLAKLIECMYLIDKLNKFNKFNYNFFNFCSAKKYINEFIFNWA